MQTLTRAPCIRSCKFILLDSVAAGALIHMLTCRENERFQSYLVTCLVVPRLAEIFDEAEEAKLLGPDLARELHNYVSSFNVVPAYVFASFIAPLQMRKGRSEARNADVSTIKNGIFAWDTGVDWKPSRPKERRESGRKHPVCSILLCPPNFTEAEIE